MITIIMIIIATIIIVPLTFMMVIGIRADISAARNKKLETEKRLVFEKSIDQLETKDYKKLIDTYESRDYLYSTEYNKYFKIQHLPHILLKYSKNNIEITRENLLEEYNMYGVETSIWISTNKHNADIGTGGSNLRIDITDINKTYFFKDEWLNIQRNKKLEKILNDV